MASRSVGISAALLLIQSTTTASGGNTTIAIGSDQKWEINGSPISKGSTGEGLLLNARLIQAVFDDDNASTRQNWIYPDTKEWDPDRNTNELIGNLSTFHDAGMVGFTVGLQGGSPHCYGNPQKWNVSAFNPDGSLKLPWLNRLERLLAATDKIGMVPIVQFFYYQQFSQLESPQAVTRAITGITQWLVSTDYKNFLVEVFNEKCTADQAVMVDLVHSVSEKAGRKLLASSSCGGGGHPAPELVTSADFVLIHGNGRSPEEITQMVAGVRAMPEYSAHPKPIVFNEDDHGCFTGKIDPTSSNLGAAVGSKASWGFLCCCDETVQGDYHTGFQCPPVNWAEGPCLSGPKGLPLPNGSKADWLDATSRLTTVLN